jgi:hypothetical protein
MTIRVPHCVVIMLCEACNNLNMVSMNCVAIQTTCSSQQPIEETQLRSIRNIVGIYQI